MKLFEQEITLDKVFEVTNPISGEISPNGISAIIKLCNREQLHLPDFNILGTEWRVQSGKYAGTFTRRYANWLYKHYGWTLSPRVLQELGNLCQLHVSSVYKHFVDITQTIDWEAGDFGDNHSCIMEDENITSYMESKGIFALRVYQPEIYHDVLYPDFKSIYQTYKHKYGKGRAWFIMGDGRNGLPKNTGVIFNGYGDLEVHPTLSLARLMSYIFGMNYTETVLTINGHEHGKIWVNSKKYIDIDGNEEYIGMGYLIGATNTIDNISKKGKLDIRL